MVVYVVPYVVQVLRNHLADGYLVGGNAQLVHQRERIIVRAVAGAEAGHGDTDDAAVVVAQAVSRLHAYQERERAVQAAGDTHHHRLRMRVLPAAHQAVGLYREHIHAVLILVRLRRQEGRHREGAMEGLGEVLIALYRGNIDFAVMPHLVGGEVGVSLALGAQTLDVNLLNNHVRHALEAFALAEHSPVLGNIGRAGEHNIGRALAHARGGIDIAAMHAGRLLHNHLATVGVLPHEAVARRQVEDKFSALYRQLGRGRQRAPQVFAYLYAEAVVARSEEQIGAERHIAAP